MLRCESCSDDNNCLIRLQGGINYIKSFDLGLQLMPGLLTLSKPCLSTMEWSNMMTSCGDGPITLGIIHTCVLIEWYQSAVVIQLVDYGYEFTCGLFEMQQIKTVVGCYGYSDVWNH